jgi:hypothetical protein
VNGVELVDVPPEVVTEIGPVEAEAGTVAVILVSELTVNVAAAPLNVTALAAVNPEPLIVSFVPMAPDGGAKDEITGWARAVAAPGPRNVRVRRGRIQRRVSVHRRIGCPQRLVRRA